MTHQQQPPPHAPIVANRKRFARKDIVLYRDQVAFWLGQARHTTICQVERMEILNGQERYSLVELHTGTRIVAVDPFFMRLLPREDAMRDIDTAPLREEDLGEMSCAAVAWLRQQSTDQPVLPSADSPRSV